MAVIMENSFTKRDTNICKGIAILFMILHHCVGKYYNVFDISWYAENSTGIFSLFILFLSTAGKVCVSIFSILSGFGITKSYISYSNSAHTIKYKNIKFVLSNLLRFYSIYIACFIVEFLNLAIRMKEQLLPFYSINYSIKEAICFFLLDISGISQFFQIPKLFENWYIHVIILFYFLFPLLQFITKKLRIAAVFISLLPGIIVTCRGESIPNEFIFYIFPFVVGIYIAQNNVFDRLNKYRGRKASVISALLFCAFFALRLVFAIPIDCFFGLSIILFEFFVFSQTKGASGILEYLGKYSADLWLLHIMYIDMSSRLSLRFLRSFVMSLLLSIGIESVKDVSGFNGLIKRLRKKLCS